MNYLECKIKRAMLKKMPAATEKEVRAKMMPYLGRFNLHLTSEEIQLPHQLSPSQLQALKQEGYYLHTRSIPFRNVIVIKEDVKGIYLLLRSGHLFFLSRTLPQWRLYNPYHQGETFGHWWQQSKTRKRLSHIGNHFKTLWTCKRRK